MYSQKKKNSSLENIEALQKYHDHLNDHSQNAKMTGDQWAEIKKEIEIVKKLIKDKHNKLSPEEIKQKMNNIKKRGTQKMSRDEHLDLQEQIKNLQKLYNNKKIKKSVRNNIKKAILKAMEQLSLFDQMEIKPDKEPVGFENGGPKTVKRKAHPMKTKSGKVVQVKESKVFQSKGKQPKEGKHKFPVTSDYRVPDSKEKFDQIESVHRHKSKMLYETSKRYLPGTMAHGKYMEASNRHHEAAEANMYAAKNHEDKHRVHDADEKSNRAEIFEDHAVKHHIEQEIPAANRYKKIANEQIKKHEEAIEAHKKNFEDKDLTPEIQNRNARMISKHMKAINEHKKLMNHKTDIFHEGARNSRLSTSNDLHGMTKNILEETGRDKNKLSPLEKDILNMSDGNLSTLTGLNNYRDLDIIRNQWQEWYRKNREKYDLDKDHVSTGGNMNWRVAWNMFKRDKGIDKFELKDGEHRASSNSLNLIRDHYKAKALYPHLANQELHDRATEELKKHRFFSPEDKKEHKKYIAKEINGIKKKWEPVKKRTSDGDIKFNASDKKEINRFMGQYAESNTDPMYRNIFIEDKGMKKKVLDFTKDYIGMINSHGSQFAHNAMSRKLDETNMSSNITSALHRFMMTFLSKRYGTEWMK